LWRANRRGEPINGTARNELADGDMIVFRPAGATLALHAILGADSFIVSKVPPQRAA